MGTNVSEESVTSIFSVEVPFLREVGASTFLQNISYYTPDYMAA
jgi:hypothetical protein